MSWIVALTFTSGQKPNLSVQSTEGNWAILSSGCCVFKILKVIQFLGLWICDYSMKVLGNTLFRSYLFWVILRMWRQKRNTNLSSTSGLESIPVRRYAKWLDSVSSPGNRDTHIKYKSKQHLHLRAASVFSLDGLPIVKQSAEHGITRKSSCHVETQGQKDFHVFNDFRGRKRLPLLVPLSLIKARVRNNNANNSKNNNSPVNYELNLPAD